MNTAHRCNIPVNYNVRRNLTQVRLFRYKECVIRIFKNETVYQWEVGVFPNSKARDLIIKSCGLERVRLPLVGRMLTRTYANTIKGAVRRAKFEVDLFSS